MKPFVIFLFLAVSMSSRASHIIGGDIYYDYLGNNQYRFYITLYRDCNSTGADYDDPLHLTIYNSSGGLIQNVDVPFPGSVILPLNFNNPCATPPGNICVERAIYTYVLTLPPIPGGYTISYQRCCRGPNITNLINPDDTGLTLTTHIPGSETGAFNNSSPRFNDYPPILLCNMEEKIINHSATDPDGDSLVYALITPFSGATSNNPAPNQAPPPPYFPVQWFGPFSENLPLGPGSSTVINSQTGILTVDPVNVGLFVVGVVVKEYRNGVLINQTVRDFVFKVFDCNITLQAILPTQEELSTFSSYCQGLTVQFENSSYGGSDYAWDFGVDELSNDVSSVYAPVYTYPEPGTYEARLIVNPGQPCTDTAYITITVNNPFSILWVSDDSLCILNNSFDFIGQMSNPSASFNWLFDSDAQFDDASQLNVNNVSFTVPGYHIITIEGDDGFCQTSYTDSIFIFDFPTANFQFPENEQCLGYTIPFQNQSQNAFNYQWDFGEFNNNQDQSSEFEPSYTYSQSGIFDVQLISSSTLGCSDTLIQQVHILEPLNMAINHTDSLCITEGFFDFYAEVSGPDQYQLLWNFGASANPTTSTLEEVLNVEFLEYGIVPIMLIGTYDVCADTLFDQVRVFGEPQIGFSYNNGIQCAPATAFFTNTSFSDGPASYFWDFGDNGLSTAFSPSHIYTEVGSYSVGLTMVTTVGCIDTLYIMQQDLVVVQPNPTAAFTVSPERTDICNAEITFTDYSMDAEDYFYVFDQGFISTEPNFVHQYINEGSDYPLLVVTNQFGCSDTARATVLIEPFEIYIPNTFIPDDNTVNDLFFARTDFEILEWDFSIYNRWGELIFNTTELSKGWDGDFEGMNSPVGTYLWVAKYRGCNSPIETKILKGFVNLLR